MLVILNNKSNLELEEFEIYIKELSTIKTEQKVVLCPSNIYLTNFHLKNISLGSQNVSSYENGAYTGEVSAKQLKKLGVKYSLVGHSERRKYQKENNQDINKKIKQLLKEEMIPILCVGEEKKQKQEGIRIESILKELEECMRDIDQEKVIIAYEPIWAIGTGEVPTRMEIDQVLKEIKKVYPTVKTIYGGSVNQNNIKELKTSEQIEGYLLGGISLKIKDLELLLKELDQ